MATRHAAGASSGDDFIRVAAAGALVGAIGALFATAAVRHAQARARMKPAELQEQGGEMGTLISSGRKPACQEHSSDLFTDLTVPQIARMYDGTMRGVDVSLPTQDEALA